ncbi:Xaa-Pro dipeptidase [Saliniradius amylolyticus]|uniref:Xaa-Pro dipeptidase n=1 Tax=Saliniradius amylolyticus TaxID=2183582 RepID=A0A2S2E5D5_9ALTE|nr:YigZ family protein [Saliniradius amylolyticus]AWL12440.1 Xaa-Pro dipeptidase [Saliniradius amylolyticus]
MSTKSYRIPAAEQLYELEIKRSKHIAYATRASSKDEAEAYIREIREQHPQANHVCWAYIAGAPGTTVTSMSDDGEPSGTAGMPMLKVLQYSGLGEIVVAVVRYFGGIKLGTGGLQRAYSDSVTGVLALLPTREFVSRTELSLTYDYAQDGAISQLLQSFNIDNLESDYGEQITVTLAVADDQMESLKAQLTNICSGQIRIDKSK